VTEFLLDTNVALWLLFGDRERVSGSVAAALEDERNAIAISAASVWEIAIKRSLGKLEIEDSWPTALARLGFDPMPVTAVHAEAVEHLPWHHRDPFDRLLVAQASAESRTLVTADPRIAAYEVDVLW
jgi:PIN domain nuclease of toxin-antitoxin system